MIVCGILVTSAAAESYPEEPLLWQPYELLMTIVRYEGSAGARAAVSFAAFSLTCAQLGMNVNGYVKSSTRKVRLTSFTRNGYSNGVRLTTLFPSYIDTRRGTYICAVWGLAICPWYIVSKASGFTRFLAGSAIFTAPVAALM